jgi:hypothetical protein
MDVIAAHVARLPRPDERWAPEPLERAELIEGLLDGKVAGPAGHLLDNVRGNIRMLLEGDPDKQFGLSGLGEPLGFEEVLGLVSEASGTWIDPSRAEGEVWIDPATVLGQADAMGEALASAARAGRTVLIATGHPGGLDLLYRAIEDLLLAHGATTIRPADGAMWADPDRVHPWHIGYWGSVGMLHDGEHPRHTHSGDPMNRMLEAVGGPPDLVLADHGFAGSAIERGIATVSIADVNDPALLVARAQGRTDVVMCLDDHVAPDAYWPIFRAIAARFG